MDSFSTHLTAAKEKLGIDFTLKEQQLEALQSVYEGKSTICLFPTGFGKSVIYQMTPYLLEHKVENAITLVISPLNSIMQDQVKKLSQRGVKACYLDMKCQSGETYKFQSEKPESTRGNSDADADVSVSQSASTDIEEPPALLQVSVSIDEIISEGYQLIYAHPEAFLTSPRGKALIRTPTFRRRVCCIAIDEAHMIAEWGDEFRTAFSRLKNLPALCRQATTLVLTATASRVILEKIIKDLGLQSPVCIKVHPDRPNIMYIKVKRSPSTRQVDDLDEILLQVSRGLKSMGREYPITIMYTYNSKVIGYAYKYLEEALRGKQYVGEKIPENRLFGQYHQNYCKRLKAHIVSELATEKSKVRFVVATIALGMGLDSPAVRKVIHFGSPSSIEKYLQETGRAGRDGQPAEAILYYNATDIRRNRPGQTTSMAEYCKLENSCLRQFLMQYLDFEVPDERSLCQCCQFCKPLCNCIKCIGEGLEQVQVSRE